EEEILAGLRKRFVAPSAAREQMELVIVDDYRRLLSPSVEVELRMELKTRADEEAIRIFGQNLEGLLLAPPAGGKITLGVDPGFRTGCKLAVVGRTGALLATGILYLHQEDRARREIVALVERHGVELVAVGNGTASRETDRLVREALRAIPADRRPAAVLVNEAGASVYSASDLAREELPELDLTLRSAVSIARRLQDPLAELVKIDPKSIGVGQYQHDVNQRELARSLDAVVEDCVNAVGVDVNTASAPLLARVSGLNNTLAKNIVTWRDENGAFQSRKQLRDVPRFGEKAFEQAAGFLRIPGAANPLDASAVHPEAYPVAARILERLQTEASDVMGKSGALKGLSPSDFTDERFGLPTVRDIFNEIEKPGRDPRPEFTTAKFQEGINSLNDLTPGMILEGVVTNVPNYGASVDVGVHH